VEVLVPVHGLTDAHVEAERMVRAGADGVFTFEGPHDVFLPLALAAGAGGALMTNVAIAFPRNAVHLAHAAWDLQALCGGRFTLGLGAQIRTHVERRFGVDFDDPVGRMRDTVEAVRAVFASWSLGEPLEHRGPYRTHTLMTPMFTPPAGEWGPPPIHVGALGPRMTTMAAACADGLASMAVTSERFFTERTLPAVRAGLDRRAEELGPFELLPELIICTGRDERELAAADQGCRALLGFYASTPAYRPVLDIEGYGELQPVAQGLTRQGRWDELTGLVEDDLLTRIAVRGTPAEVAAEVARRYAQHARRLAIYLPYELADDLLEELFAALHAI
jgi:probable F420-dependent oxidoreductase